MGGKKGESETEWLEKAQSEAWPFNPEGLLCIWLCYLKFYPCLIWLYVSKNEKKYNGSTFLKNYSIKVFVILMWLGTLLRQDSRVVKITLREPKTQRSWELGPHLSQFCKLQSIRADFAGLVWHKNVTYSLHTKCNGDSRGIFSYSSQQ